MRNFDGMLQGGCKFLLNLRIGSEGPGKKAKREINMIFHSTEREYRTPGCSIIRLDEEADVCNGTNTPGAGDYGDEDLGDI